MRLSIKSHYQAEISIARRLHELWNSEITKIPSDRIEYEEKFDSHQRLAVSSTCNSPISIVCGFPGTGKTAITKSIVKTLDSYGFSGIVTCPTGAATRRARSSITENGKLNYRVIFGTNHKILGMIPGGGRRPGAGMLECDYVIVDEATMQGNLVCEVLLNSIKPGTRIIFVGDPNQLPSVSSGKIMLDMMDSGCIPKFELKKIYRQAENSGIAQNCQRIMEGKALLSHDPESGKKFNDFFFAARETQEDILKFLISSVTDKIPKARSLNPLEDIQVICPGHKGLVGAINVNNMLREILVPDGEEFLGFRVGDRVVNKKNAEEKYGIVNGDMGTVLEASNSGLTVNFGEGTGVDMSGIVELPAPFTTNVLHSLALTVHSTQGCEFPCVVMPIHTTHYRLLNRNNFYTSASRPRELFVGSGSTRGLSACLNNCANKERLTGLSQEIDRLFNA